MTRSPALTPALSTMWRGSSRPASTYGPPLSTWWRGGQVGVRYTAPPSGEQVAQRRLRRGKAEGEAQAQQPLRHLALTVEE